MPEQVGLQIIVIFEPHSGNGLAAENLVLEKDTELTPESIVVDGVEYKVVGKVQNSEDPEDRVDITVGSLRVINGGIADISTDGTMKFTYLGVDDHDSAGNSTATLTAAQSIAIGTLVTTDGVTSLTSTGSSVTVNSLNASDKANVAVQAQTGFNSDELDANDATVTVTSQGSAAVKKLTATEKANVTVQAQTRFNSDVLNATKAATVTVTSQGIATVKKLTATEKANVTVQAQTGFNSDELDANDSTVTVTSQLVHR